MSMNSTPVSERVHIGIFGKRNAGKSSLLNAITGQDAAVVSPVKGTTTDPVKKTMEMLPLGPVMLIDTAGIDDDGNLGELRVEKTRQVLRQTDIALLVVDASTGITREDEELLRMFSEYGIRHLTVYNKCDLVSKKQDVQGRYVSAVTGVGIRQLKEAIAALMPGNEPQQHIVSDLIKPLDTVVLVTPIDTSAPKGRLILPQQLTIRDILERDAICAVTKENALGETLKNLAKKPALVITDSQVFAQVADIVPQDVPLTSFSILFARYKGQLESAVAGAHMLDELRDGDLVLIAEGCTHHRQCDDIGTVKLPGWIKAYTGVSPEFVYTSGGEFPADLSSLRLIIHCGGCMLPRREMQYRLKTAQSQGIPITNYGIAIAHIHGILERSLTVFAKI